MEKDALVISATDGRSRLFSVDGTLLSVDGVPVAEQVQESEEKNEMKEEEIDA